MRAEVKVSPIRKEVEAVAVVTEGSAIRTPAGVPHSPRFPPDAYLMVTERKRRPGEIDRIYLDISKARRLLGWSPRVTLEEGAQRTTKFFRDAATREKAVRVGSTEGQTE